MYAVPSTAVICSSMMCSPGTLSRYFLNDFEMVPFAPVITGLIFLLCTLSVFQLQSIYYYYYYYYYYISRPARRLCRILGSTIRHVSALAF
jgi:hypothetical protein